MSEWFHQKPRFSPITNLKNGTQFLPLELKKCKKPENEEAYLWETLPRDGDLVSALNCLPMIFEVPIHSTPLFQ